LQKRSITILLIFSIILGIVLPVGAAEERNTRAIWSEYTITVDGTKAPIRIFDIDGNVFVSPFEVAKAFSGSESQFATGWIEKNRLLRITSGVQHTVIGFNLSGRVLRNSTAKPVEIDIQHNGIYIPVSAYSITNDIFIDLYEIAKLLDFCLERFPVDKIININTSKSYDESATIRMIDPDKPMIALTFDDGPSYVTVMILDALEKYGGVATFYVVGNRISRNQRQREILLRAHEMGNEIANHSWSHPFLSRISEDRVRRELVRTNEVIESITGEPPVNMRPPYADINSSVFRVTADLGLPIILWSVDPSDWRTRNANTTFKRVMENIEDRDIVLLHDLWEPSGEAAVRLIPALIEKGFQLVTVSELMYHSGITPIPGQIYESAAG